MSHIDDSEQILQPEDAGKTIQQSDSKNSPTDSLSNALIDKNKNRNSESAQSTEIIRLPLNNVQSPTACIAMKSTFSTLKWINCIQQR